MKSEDPGYHLGYVPECLLASGRTAVLRGLLDLPGAAPVPGLDAVTLPPTRLSFMAAEAMASPTSVTAEYRAARSRAMGLGAAARVTGIDLLPHQWDFVSFAHDKRAVLNASEQGTGKTRAAWALWEFWQAKRTLIVCPKSLVHQWRQEYERTWPNDEPNAHIWTMGDGPVPLRQAMLKDAASYDMGPPVVILNYEVLVRLLPEILKFAPDCLILDESWRIKNSRAAVSRAVHKLTAKLDPRVMLLTGTPIGNHVGDLWSQLKVMGPAAMPDKYGNFLAAHAVLQPIVLHGRTILKPKDVQNLGGLMARLEPYWYRVTKEGCLDLPPKQYHTVTLDLPAATRALYRQVEKDGGAALGAPGSLDSEAVIMLRLQQIAGGHEPVATDERGAHWTTRPLPCPKIDWLEQFARDRLAGNPGARALVWCRFLAEVFRVTGALRDILGWSRVELAYGNVTNQELDQFKASYNSRDEDGVQVLVCQVQKMAYGHNLQATDYSIHFSPTWSYVERVQSEDRAHRQGREGAVQYFDLLARGTIDVQVAAAIRRKEDLALRLCPATF